MEMQKWLRQQSSYCCGFRRTCKAMWHMYQCWCGICRERNIFIQVSGLFTDYPSYIHHDCNLFHFPEIVKDNFYQLPWIIIAKILQAYKLRTWKIYGLTINAHRHTCINNANNFTIICEPYTMRQWNIFQFA
jgi:hypothetical protein